MAIAVECCGGLLRHRPIARRRIQFRVDRTRLHVVDRDAPAPDFSGQRLSKHLDGSLRARVGHKPGRRDALTYRSEEHTSELQSLAYLVCRLLLEKKKQGRDSVLRDSSS